MKHFSILVLVFLFSVILNSQHTFDGTFSNLWSETGNWSTSAMPQQSDVVILSSSMSSLVIDITAATARKLKFAASSGAVNVSESLNSQLEIVTIANNNSFWLDPATAIEVPNAVSNIDATLDNTISFTNTTGVSTIKNFGIDNILTFGDNSSLTSAQRIVFNNKGTINLKGSLTATGDRIQFNQSGTINITDGAVISGAPIYLNAGTKVFVNANGTITNSVIWINGNATSDLTINSADAIEGHLKFLKKTTLNLYVNANVSNLGELVLSTVADEGGNSNHSNLNLTIDPAVTELYFDDSNSTKGNSDNSFNITGFKENVIRFGTDANGLSSDQLNQITADGLGLGKALILDSNGYLVAASTASLKNNHLNKIRIFPNPVTDVLNFMTDDTAVKLEIRDLLGRKIYDEPAVRNSFDVSSFVKGVYILKLTTTKGILTTKFVKK